MKGLKDRKQCQYIEFSASCAYFDYNRKYSVPQNYVSFTFEM